MPASASSQAEDHKMKNGGSTSAQVLPWVFAGVGMVGAIVVFVWGQINPKVDIGNVETRLDVRATQIEQREKDAIDEVKHLINLRLMASTYEEYKVRKDEDTKRQDEVIRMLAQTRVHRTEYERELANIAERITALRTVVEKLQADIFGSYNVGKQLDNLQAQQVKQSEITAAQIQELRRVIDLVRVAPSAPISAPGAAISVPGATINRTPN